jgi:hypothetical protein
MYWSTLATWWGEHYILAKTLLFTVSWLLAARVVYPRDRHVICLGDKIIVVVRIIGFYVLFLLPIFFWALGLV